MSTPKAGRSIKGLKLKIEEKYKFWLGEGENYSEVASEVFGILQLVNSFEASVWEKINEIKERDERTLQVSGVPSGAHPILEELREILGEGDPK